jgi:hypothetical protein
MCQNLDLRFLLFYCLFVLVFFLSFYSPLFIFFCVSVFYCLSPFLFVFLLLRLSLFYAEAGTMPSVRLPPKRGGRLAFHAFAHLSKRFFWWSIKNIVLFTLLYTGLYVRI